MWYTLVGVLTLLAVLVLVIVVTVLLHYMIENVGLGCFWSLVLAATLIWALATDKLNPFDDLHAMGHLTLYSLGAI